MGLYIHVPFCERKCPYCDFYSMVATPETMDIYVEKVLAYARTFPLKSPVNTLYFGGGTPTMLGSQRLSTLLLGLKSILNITEDCEITLEANPVSVGKLDFSALVVAGFNRISFGIQSTNPDTLKTLGRLHTREEGFTAITEAHKAGFRNISADLMVGIPEQSLGEITNSIGELSALPITHLSIYLLKLEEGTPFYQQYPELDEDFSAECYHHVVEKAEAYGFSQYEISNFSHEGFPSRHNLKYWQLEDYLGIGPSAHSMVRGKRFYFPPDLDAFLKGDWGIVVEDGDAGGLWEEVMLGLRLNKGLDLIALAEKYGKDTVNKIKKQAEILAKNGLLYVTQQGISLTTKGFLVSNTIIVALLKDIA